MNAGILIIDDEAGIRRALASILEDEKYQVFTAEDAIVGMEFLEHEEINLVFLDVLLPRMGGLEALEKIRAARENIEVVMISGHANVDMAVRAVKLGAFDFLEKPLSLDKVLAVCRNALTMQKLRLENQDLKQRTRADLGIDGESKAMKAVRDLISQAASSDARILITGENGTGKELAARAIHNLSARSQGPFVEVNCAAIPENLIESELFGHEKGAFTDAVSQRKGRFELAHGGTLFLDEIGDMSQNAQAKVLRAIQEQKIERLGGEKTIETDVRIIAASNKDLSAECNAGRFREDLFFRLNVIPIRMPPLRDRAEDIPFLLLQFMKELGSGNIEFEADTLSMLSSYSWPGNVRELRNLAERITVMHQGGRVNAGELGGFLRENPSSEARAGGMGNSPAAIKLLHILDTNYSTAKDSFEKFYLEYKLSQNGGIISRTAEAIGLYPSNLHAKLRKHHIHDKET
ncbi:MAG: sigma-54 dependent transcriptional regulator [Treponema sp.]|jgi:two-component system nitrogen regulation response regulator NtrX|nr:sigma-54 dependent transcriptional regulator [Treponema sp.]